MRPFKEIWDTVMTYEFAMTKEALDGAIETAKSFTKEERVLWAIVQSNMRGFVTFQRNITSRTGLSDKEVRKIVSTLLGQNIIEIAIAVDDEGFLAGRGYRFLNHSF